MRLTRATALQLAKTAAIIAILAALIVYAGPREIARTLSSVNLVFLMIPLGIVIVDQAFRVLAWRALLRARGHTVSLGAVADGFIAGTFLGALVPSTLGTDASRAVAIAHSTKVPLREAGTAVLVLSLFGLFAMSVAAVASGTLMLVLGRSIVVTRLAILIALGFIALLLVLLEGRLPAAAMSTLGRFRLARPLAERLERWYAALHAYTRRDVLWSIAWITLVNQVLNIAWYYASSEALGLQVPLLYFVLLVPIIMLGKLVPLSVMGFGVEQGYFAYLFSQLGVPVADAVALSLLIGALTVIYGLMCGVFYVGTQLRRLVRGATSPKPGDAL